MQKIDNIEKYISNFPKDVQILLLKHDKHNKFSLVKQIGKTNCYGQFDFYASPSTSGLYLAFVKV